ncbi:MAG: clostripain-related cysteine peptidase [Parabacteroides sp.]
MKYKILAIIIALCFTLASCGGDDKKEDTTTSRTVLVYMIANNSLSSNAKENLESMVTVGTNANLNGGNLIVYYAPKGATPELIQIKENSKGIVVKNLIKSYNEQNSVDPAIMQSVISDVKSLFPADSYGLVLWSHGTSWLPSNVSIYLKAFGQDGSNWMEIYDLASGLPDHGFDFIMFDACYMANIECAYELKDKTDYILASPTETMADGWPYQKMIPYFFTKTLQLDLVAQTFYNYYYSQSGDYQTATVSIIKTSGLSTLASAAKGIFSTKTTNDLYGVDLSKMQKLEFLRKNGSVNPCLLYDMDDYIKQLGTTEQYAQFKSALANVITYEAHTPKAYFAGLGYSYPINECCGLSVYVPQSTTTNLTEWYKQLQWYKAVYNQ